MNHLSQHQGATTLFGDETVSQWEDLLDDVMDVGINAFDTGLVYADQDGTCDERLGRWINERNVRDKVMLVVGSIFGVQIGQKLGEKIDSSGLKALLAILLLVVGIAIAYDTFFAEEAIKAITGNNPRCI